MDPDGLHQLAMKLKHSILASAPDANRRRFGNSHSSVANKLSHIAPRADPIGGRPPASRLKPARTSRRSRESIAPRTQLLRPAAPFGQFLAPQRRGRVARCVPAALSVTNRPARRPAGSPAMSPPGKAALAVGKGERWRLSVTGPFIEAHIDVRRNPCCRTISVPQVCPGTNRDLLGSDQSLIQSIENIEETGAGTQNRTVDLLITNQLLYR